MPRRASWSLGRASVPQQLGAAAVVVYVCVFVLLLVYGRPGLGIGQGFYLAIIPVALARGPLAGATAGVLAAVLYDIALTLPSPAAWNDVVRAPLEIRLATYVAVGVAVGYFARKGRRLLGESLHVLDDLLTIAQRDLETAALKPRGLEAAIARRVAHHWPFALVAGEVEAPRRRRLWSGAEEDVAREIARRIGGGASVGIEVARIGPTQFCALLPCTTLVEARAAAAELERELDATGFTATFGWALHPQEGDDALTLFRAASERLYARRIVRGEWQPTATSAELGPQVA